jgi:MFS family permease
VVRRSPLWSNRDFQVLCVAQGLSKFGTQVSTIALPLVAVYSGHSAAGASVVASVGGLAQILVLLPGGVVADRLNRRVLAIVCDVGCLLSMGLLGLAVLLGHPPLAVLVVVAVVAFGLGGVFYSASSAILRQVVSDAELPGAVAVNQARNSAAYLCGPFVGGLLFYLSPAAPFLVDALTYALSLTGFLLIRARLGRPQRTMPDRNVVRDVGAGVAFLWRNVCLRWTLVISSMMNCAFAGILFTVIVRGAGSPSSGVSAGFVIGCAGGGSLLGSLVAVRAKDLMGPRATVIVVVTGCALLTSVLVTGVSPLVQAAVLFCCACLVPTLNVVLGSAQILLTPNELQGRMHAATSFLAICTYPLGPVAAGALLVHGSPTLAFLAFNAVLVATAVFSVGLGSLRHLPDSRQQLASTAA